MWTDTLQDVSMHRRLKNGLSRDLFTDSKLSSNMDGEHDDGNYISLGKKVDTCESLSE